MKNIVLIGMPGAGKSTVGVVLAKTLGMPFLDTDLLIQQREGRLLQEIINAGGIEEFMKIEEDILSGVELEGHVVATGGSAVYSDKGMRHLKRTSLVIYLCLPYEIIEERLNNITTRGIAMGEGQSLHDLYAERLPLYEKYADITLDCGELPFEGVIACLKKLASGCI